MKSRKKLSDVCTIKYGKDHKNLKDGKYPVYGSGGMMRFADQYLYDRPSILIPRKGSLGNLFYTESPFWTIDTLFYTEIDEEIIVPKYLYYQLLVKDLAALNMGTAVPSLTTDILNDLKIDVPSIEEQIKISDFLSVLDQKIENNNTIIENLEEQAQVLFKNWFVDFGPFQNGEFTRNSVGLIPKNWKVKSLDEIAEYTNGLAMQKYRPNKGEDSLPVLKIKELRANRTNESSERSRTDIPDKVKVFDGDVIFSWSGSLLVEIWTGGMAGLNQHLFKVTSKRYEK